MYINLQAGLHVPSRTVVLKPVANIGRTKESMSMYMYEWAEEYL